MGSHSAAEDLRKPALPDSFTVFSNFFSGRSSTSYTKGNASSLHRHEEVLMIFLLMVLVYIFNGGILKYVMREN